MGVSSPSSTELMTHRPQRATSCHATLTGISPVRVICHQWPLYKSQDQNQVILLHRFHPAHDGIFPERLFENYGIMSALETFEGPDIFQ